MLRTSLAAMAVLLWTGATAAAAEVHNEIGVLTCTLADPGETPAGEARAGGQMRDAICNFRLKSGAEETYAGRIEGVSITTERPGALLWRVKVESGPVEPGLLQQVYAAHPAKPADQKPPLIGEANSKIALHFMADKDEGSASVAQKPGPTGFVILSVELKLKTTSG